MNVCCCTLAGTPACITCPNAQGHYMPWWGNYPPSRFLPYKQDTVAPQPIDYEKLAAELIKQMQR